MRPDNAIVALCADASFGHARQLCSALAWCQPATARALMRRLRRSVVLRVQAVLLLLNRHAVNRDLRGRLLVLSLDYAKRFPPAPVPFFTGPTEPMRLLPSMFCHPPRGGEDDSEEEYWRRRFEAGDAWVPSDSDDDEAAA